MYDSDPEALAAQRAEQSQPKPPVLQEDPGPAIPAHLTVEAIAECDMCDGEGYRHNGTICDHQDRTAVAAAGSAKCREVLAKKGHQ